MAHYQQTTFCEVTYDSDWLSFEDEDDRHITPYRCSLMRNDPDSNSDTGHYAPPVNHIGQQGRATTWHAFNKDNTSELSRAVESEPTRIRPTYPFPSLHLLQGCDSGDELDEAYVYTDRTKKKLLWVDALNKWIPQKKLHPPPYLSFVGNPPVVEKEVNLGQSRENIEKREAIRKRAQELAEQRRQQRKVRITLRYHLSVLRLCSILTNRIDESAIEHHMNRAQVQSSRSHSSLPVSPIHRKEKVPSPKQVWRAEEGPKLQTIHEPKPEPVKREISITLMSPQPEELHMNREQVQSSRSHSSLSISPIHMEEKVPSPEQVWQAEDGPQIQTIHEPKPEPAKREISITLMSPQPEELHMNREQLQSSRSHSSLSISPIHMEEKVPSPEHVWQAEEGPKLQTIHEPKPEPAKREISITLMSPQPEGCSIRLESTEEKLPITKPSEVEPIVIEEVKKPQSPAEETKEIRKSVVEVVKKERRDLRKPTLPQPNFTGKKRELRFFEADTRSEKHDKEKVTSTPSGSPPSLLGTLNPELIEKETSDQKEQQRRNTLSKLISGDKAAKLRKPGQLDNSYSDELELEEERRKKQMEMYEKLKNRKRHSVYGDLDDGSPRFDDYGFLSKYCIFNKGNIEMYRHAFDVEKPPPYAVPLPQQGYGPPPQQGHGPPPQQGYGPSPQQGYGPPPPGHYGYPHGPPQPYYPPPQQMMQQASNTTVVVTGAAAAPTVVQLERRERCADKICLNIFLSIIFWPWILIWICLCIFES